MSDDRGGGGGLGAALVILLVVGAIVKFWVWIVAILGVFAVGAAAVVLFARIERHVQAREAAAAAIVSRADEQHRQLLAGDDRGLYGIYPPAKPPAPTPVAERMPGAGENWADYLAEQRRKALAS